MANFIKFVDTMDFKPIEVSEQTRKDNFGPAANNSALIVKIAATHAGLITRNNGFYLPDRMRKGAASFTAHYGKPIQVHHNDQADPVGRVVAADYVDISANVKDKFLARIVNGTKGRYNDKFVQDFLGGSLSYIQAVNFVTDSLNNKDSILDDPDYQGLGFIQLTASITDPEAKQKILDGRYLTGSVGVTTNRAVCSVCKQDWTSDDGRCEHRPGKVYDGARAFIITGDLTYDEYSFVNVPADRHSRVIEVNVNGIHDSVEMDSSVGRTISVNLITDSVDSTKSKDKMGVTSQEEKMDKEKLLASLKQKFTLVDEAAWTSITFDDSVDEIEAVINTESHLDMLSLTAIFAMDDTAKKLEALKALRPNLGATAFETVASEKYEDFAKFTAAVNAVEWCDYAESEDEAIIAHVVAHPEDATLSPAQRKRLPGSSFCGPNKSFPLPDLARLDATRRILNIASASGYLKSAVLSNINRKVIALQTVKDSTPVVEEKKEEPVVEDVKSEDNATACPSCADGIKALDAVKAELATAQTQLVEITAAKDALTAQLQTLTASNVEMESNLDATRKELQLVNADLVQMADQLVTAQETSLGFIADNIIVLRRLSGEKIADSVRDELITLGEDAVKKQLTEVTAKVDMNKITDSINSGLARTPEGTVADPTGNLEGTKKKIDKKKIASIADEYLRIKFGGHSPYGTGKDAAQRFKEDMQRQGLLPTG